MVPYFNEINNNNVVYSVDMLRIHFNIEADKNAEFGSFMRYVVLQHLAEHYQSARMWNYKHLLSINGVKIGLLFNSGKNSTDTLKGFIEFNPNKQHFLFLELKKHLDLFCVNYVVHTFDLAVDLKVPRQNVFFFKDKRDYRFFEKYIDSSASYGVTEYLGKRNNNGYCKLYNKKEESNLDYDLTRFEITLNELTYSNLLKQLPTIQFFEYSFFSNLTGVTSELVKMCYQYNDFTALNMLDHRTRKKIKDDLVLKTFVFPIHIFNILKENINSYII